VPAGSKPRATSRPARPSPAAPGAVSLSTLRGRDGDSKLAARVASQIVDDVVARGWPVGTVLGSSDDFLERYDISRAVFREAVRLLEHQQVARTRRGPGGGLLVVEPSVDAITDAAVLYLLRVDARLDEVFEARLVLEEIVAELAPARIDRAGCVALRDLVAAEEAGAVTDRQALHSLLAALTGNPALELFVDILNRVSALYLRDRSSVEAVSTRTKHAHQEIAEAVTAGDEPRARRLMRDHLDDEVANLQRKRAMRQVLPSGVVMGGPAGKKRAEQVAREIFHSVVSGRLEPGHLLGSEPELIERYGVSRAVFREAVRLLEHQQIATMRRGPGGGLFVAAPSPAAVSDVVALYLARQGAGIAALAELRVRVEVEILDLVIDRLDAAGTAVLNQAAELEESDQQADVAIHNLHAAIAGLSRNRALELIVLVLIRLTRFHQYRPLSAREEDEIRREVNRTHLGIARAIQSHDRDLARRRMRRHLEVLPALLR
jgi:DNA-binding FadR family transcriptional regulator